MRDYSMSHPYCSIPGLFIYEMELDKLAMEYIVRFSEEDSREWFATIRVGRNEVDDNFHIPLDVEVTQIACAKLKELLCPSSTQDTVSDLTTEPRSVPMVISSNGNLQAREYVSLMGISYPILLDLS
ncbi:hypothetical protein [Pantoea phage Nifs112]|nr:hypothetical protein [Pantoea phage Nifs112]